MTNLADLDGLVVSAYALGFDGAESDATDWSLERSDLPRLTRLVGSLTVNHVDDLDYTQYVVNGIPVDPSSVRRADYSGSVLVGRAEFTSLPEGPG